MSEGTDKPKVNLASRACGARKPAAKTAGSGAKAEPAEPKPVKLLSGGNLQIRKADGDAPVRAYIAAMPGWQSDVGRWLDALIARAVPGVARW